MALSAFDDETAPPSAAALTRTLGATAPMWKDALRRIGRSIGKVTTEWGFSSKSTGWGLRVKRGDRVIAYLTPCDGHFLASFALGRDAVKAVLASKLPAQVLQSLAAAPRYAEGTGLRFKVSRPADVQAIAAIAIIKSAH